MGDDGAQEGECMCVFDIICTLRPSKAARDLTYVTKTAVVDKDRVKKKENEKGKWETFLFLLSSLFLWFFCSTYAAAGGGFGLVWPGL